MAAVNCSCGLRHSGNCDGAARRLRKKYERLKELYAAGYSRAYDSGYKQGHEDQMRARILDRREYEEKLKAKHI